MEESATGGKSFEDTMDMYKPPTLSFVESGAPNQTLDPHSEPHPVLVQVSYNNTDKLFKALCRVHFCADEGRHHFSLQPVYLQRTRAVSWLRLLQAWMLTARQGA